MKKPHQSYRIWHSPRSGSTLLCEMLIDTKRAGLPNEHMSPHEHPNLRVKYDIQDYHTLKQHIWNLGTDENGIFGVKISFHWENTDRVFRDLAIAKDDGNAYSLTGIMDDFFPDCKDIIISRLHKVDQATSWWKAIQDNQWHLRPGEKHDKSDAFYADKYDPDALRSLFYEAHLREIATMEFLRSLNRPFLIVNYENLIAFPDKTIHEILAYLGISVDGLPSCKFGLNPTTTRVNDEWKKRLKEDLQAHIDMKVW